MKSASRLSLIALLLLVAVTGLSGAYWWRMSINNDQIRTTTIDLAGKRGSQLANLQAQHIEALLLGIDLSLRQFRDALQAKNRAGAELIAQNILQSFPSGAIVHLAKIDAKGYFEYSSIKLPQPVYVGDRDYFDFHQKQNGKDLLFINKPIFSRSAHKWVILITRPIFKENRFDGAAFISLSPEYFSSMLAKLEMTPKDFATLLHTDGTYMARSQGLQEVLGKSVRSARPFLESASASQGVFQDGSSLDNLPRIFAWQKLRGYPLLVAIGLDEKSILEPVEQAISATRMRSAIGIGILLALAAGISLLLMRAKRQQQALFESEDQFRTIASSAQDAIIIMDAAGQIAFWNPAAEVIFGYKKDEVVGRALHQLLAPERYRAAFQAGFSRFLTSGQGNAVGRKIELEALRKDGVEIPIELSLSAVKRKNQWIAISIIRDISDRKIHEAELEHIAYYDVLTGLPNRRLLSDRLHQAIARTRRSGNSMAVCYLDLDDFKPINDRYGHEIGDQVLVIMADNLKGTLRTEDTLARLGGDEFVLLLTDLSDAEEIPVVLDRVLATVNVPIQALGSTVTLSASIGVAIFGSGDVDPDTMLRQADQAMYQAKRDGKNRYLLFDQAHDQKVQEGLHFLQRLGEALENEEFVLHYQPKVDMLSGEVIGVEALIRWQHPEEGLLSPETFLPYIDSSELEIAVGEWVIDSALQQIAAWDTAGLALNVSVNISANHLLKDDFAERLRLALERHPNVPPSYLELEILETAALSDMQQAVLTLTRCRKFGVRISIDDFGTGYSSLTYLRNLPVDILKVDQSFVRDMLNDPADLGIVVSVVQLAKTFNRMVIAEGVETLAHSSKLLHIGCQFMQGYGIARPMPAELMNDWIGKWHDKAVWRTLAPEIEHTLSTHE